MAGARALAISQFDKTIEFLIFDREPKILLSKNLCDFGMLFASQNLERIRVRRKILRNKDLQPRHLACHAF